MTINGVCINGGDVYAVGTVDNFSGYKGPISGSSLAVYWKNGGRSALSGTAYSISGIAVDGKDVYVSGSGPSSQSNDTEVKYWKNGSMIELTDTPAYYQTRTSSGIAVLNNNVYVSTNANNYLPNTTVFNIAKYWINRQPYFLINSTSKFEFTTGVFVK